jgi:hypothetical protein
MDEQSFPFRLDARSRAFLANLVGVLQSHDARFSSQAGGVQLQFLNKGANPTTIDAPIAFTGQGLQMNVPLNAVAKTSPQSAKWLRAYHSFLSKGRGEDFSPVPQRCSVTVEARTDGQLRYHLTYMVAHKDGSLAQDTPQGLLYATEALGAGAVVMPADSADNQSAGQAEPASWLIASPNLSQGE